MGYIHGIQSVFLCFMGYINLKCSNSHIIVLHCDLCHFLDDIYMLPCDAVWGWEMAEVIEVTLRNTS